MQTVKTAQHYARQQGLDRLDSDVLLAHVLGQTRTWLFTWPDKPISDDDWARFEQAVQRRQTGEPIAHIIGEREFWSLPIAVNASTLIPRPDTECLVEAVLDQWDTSPRQVVDLGTGTGAIALALASERPDWQIIAIDRVTDACTLAQHNAERLGLPIEVRQGSWCDSLPDHSVDILVSNPPYIDETDLHLAEGDVRFEPQSALVASQQGLADIKTIAEQGRRVLTPGGALYLEHGWTQGEAVRAILTHQDYHSVITLKDHGDRDRVTIGLIGSLGSGTPA